MKTILLLDDHGLLRRGLRAGMSEASGESVNWVEAGSLAEARAHIEQRVYIDLILLDLHLPDSSGLTGLTEIKSIAPDTPVWILSSTEDPMVVIQALELGAGGFISKSEPPDRIYAQINTALGCNQAVRDARLPEIPVHKVEQLRRLGRRHVEVLELVLTGCSNREIGDATGLTLGTVKNYVSAIMLVFEVSSRSHLITLFR